MSGEASDLSNLGEQASSRNDLGFHVVMLAMSAGVLLLAALLSVEAGTTVVVPLVQIPLPEMCYLRRLCGWSCPGCGMTRSFISLAHGDVPLAFQYNPAGPILFLLFAVQLPYRGWQIARLRMGRDEWRIGPWGYLPLYVWFVVLVGQWVVQLMIG